MDTAQLRKMILMRLEGLSPEYLKEIADFVFFVRLRALHPEAFESDDFSEMLRRELELLNQSEQAHVEEEFADYEKRFPSE